MRRTSASVQPGRKYQDTSLPRRDIESLLSDPTPIHAEQCKRNFSKFIKEFWETVTTDALLWNWHIDLLATELSKLAYQVSLGLPRKYDLIINIPPGTTKSIACSVMFPVWCWVNWHWMRFIAASYSAELALEQAELSRDIVRSDKFQQYFPELSIKRDKDTKSNFKVVKQNPNGTIAIGGSRYSTSVGGTLTGFHGHILLVDDPLNPHLAASDVELRKANRWIGQTLSTRKVDKAVTVTVLIMQRLHQDDPSGHLLAKKKNIRHICLPGEIATFRAFVKPVELIDNYVDDLLDPTRMPWPVMEDMEADLGQYGYAGQVGQNPSPPGGGMFKTDHLQYLSSMPSPVNLVQSVRFWDKAGTTEKENKRAAWTVGLKMHRLASGKFLVEDVKRGRWASEERERIILETAQADGHGVEIWQEQEPGSGGKDQAQATIRNLAGYSIRSDRPTGDKAVRADPYSVQVNVGSVFLLTAVWNKDYVDELKDFPFSTYADQVDASSGAFNKLARKRVAGSIFNKDRK